MRTLGHTETSSREPVGHCPWGVSGARTVFRSPVVPKEQDGLPSRNPVRLDSDSPEVHRKSSTTHPLLSRESTCVQTPTVLYPPTVLCLSPSQGSPDSTSSSGRSSTVSSLRDSYLRLSFPVPRPSLPRFRRQGTSSVLSVAVIEVLTNKE